MTHAIDDAQTELDLTVVDEQPEPMVLDFEEEYARLRLCDYCGHFPCGCGG